MFPSSTASSSSSMGTTTTTINGGSNNSNTGLIRYGSAPSSLISIAVDSVINPTREFSAIGSSSHQLLHMGPTPIQSRFFPSSAASSHNHHELKREGSIGGGGGAGMVSPSASPLVHHSSSPAGFLNHLAHACSSSSNQANNNNGFLTSRGCGISRLNSQLSFTRQETLSRISEESENVGNGLNAQNHDKRKSTHSYTNAGYGVGSWDDANTIMFSMEPGKRPKNMSSETQFQFTMPETMLEMSSMDDMLNIPENSVACRIRAKRGCATHPRSIAERERRTRISGKLKKLQDLVPNMDKQTGYADMLDLAVQHIKGLQNQVQKLNKELENCTCGCRKQQNSYRDEVS